MPMHRSLKVLAAALLAATLLSGCGVFSARTIRVGVVGEPAGLELAYTDDASAFVGSMVHAGLYRADATFAPAPVLADGDATSAAGGTKWRVTLRSGLTFHDGSPITTDDVKFTYELAASTRCPLVSDICAVVGSHLLSVEAGADGALTFTLKSPWAPWQTRGLTIPILPKATLTASLVRLQAKVEAADRNAVSLTRENIAADIDGGGCAASGATNCTYASRVAELERTLADAGLDLPDPRGYPQLNSAGEPSGSRDDEQYARALYVRLAALEGLLLAPTESQLAAAFPLLDVQSAPVGAGPYKFVERVPGSYVQLTAFKGFALGEPPMSAMTLTVFTSASGAVKAFQGGAIDWAPDLRATDVAGLSVSEDATLLHVASLRGYNYLAFNTREGRLFANSVARRALASCVDIPAIITGATDETGIEISSTVAPTSWAAETPAAAETKRDVAGARAALIADGWEAGEDGIFARAGTRLEADIIVREGQAARTRAAQLIVDQVAECGISLTVAELPFTTDIAPRLRYPNDFDLYLGAWQWSLDPDDSDIFASSACPTEEAPAGKNFVCWSSPRVDQLLAQGVSAGSISSRIGIYTTIQSLRRSERPYLLLWGDPGFALLRNRFIWETRAADVQSPLYAWSIHTWDLQK
jgi:ABC-type transport system substrate-binding protein